MSKELSKIFTKINFFQKYSKLPQNVFWASKNHQKPLKTHIYDFWGSTYQGLPSDMRNSAGDFIYIYICYQNKRTPVGNGTPYAGCQIYLVYFGYLWFLMVYSGFWMIKNFLGKFRIFFEKIKFFENFLPLLGHFFGPFLLKTHQKQLKSLILGGQIS